MTDEIPQKVESKFYTKWWFWVIIGVIFLGVLGTLFNNSSTGNVVDNEEEQESSKDTISLTPNKVNPHQEINPTWHEILSFEGDGIKNTETFSIPSNEWKISWDTEPTYNEYLGYVDMNFQIYVYNEDGDLVDLAANVIGESKDYSVMRSKGDYYLTINSGQPYEIVIEAKY